MVLQKNNTNINIIYLIIIIIVVIILILYIIHSYKLNSLSKNSYLLESYANKKKVRKLMTITGGSSSNFADNIFKSLGEKYKEDKGVTIKYKSNCNMNYKINDFTAISVSKYNYTATIHIPIATNALIFIFNIDNFKAGELILDNSTISEIYLGNITKWNNQKIVDLNPGKTLPNKKIILSGQRYSMDNNILFNYLITIDPDSWTTEKLGELYFKIFAMNESTMSKVIDKNNYSIGYINYDYTARSNPKYFKIKNNSGKNIEPNLKTITNTAKNIEWDSVSDLGISLINLPGDESYPILSALFLNIDRYNFKNFETINDINETKKFVEWILKDGSNIIKQSNYIPIQKDDIKYLLKNFDDQISKKISDAHKYDNPIIES